MAYSVCFQYALTAIRGPKLQQISGEVSKPISLSAMAGFHPVVEFLQGAGQGQLVAQVCLFVFSIRI
jgi:hypothetical protein